MEKKTLAEAAAQEAWEEAGVRGEISPDPIGAYTFSKLAKQGDGMLRIEAEVFPLAVAEEQESYPEAGERTREWMSRETAATAVQEPELRELIRRFAPGA